MFAACILGIGLLGIPAGAVVSSNATASPPGAAATERERQLLDAAGAVVGVSARALANARSNRNLGERRIGSGVLIDRGLVLTIGYLILEADQVELVTSNGRTVPAAVAAYDHATGFGLLRPIAPLEVKPIALGNSGELAELDRVLIAASGENALSVATVVSRRSFAGYWEYMIDGAIYTSPPRLDHSGAALIDRKGQLVGIGSLIVAEAAKSGEQLPGNMFVPIDLLKPILDEMIATGRQKGGARPWLGMSSMEDEGRIRVVRVSEDGPADVAGIEAGDIVLAMDGRKVEKLADFYRRLWSAGSPGVEVLLKVLHGADVRDVRVQSIDRLQYMRKKPTI